MSSSDFAFDIPLWALASCAIVLFVVFLPQNFTARNLAKSLGWAGVLTFGWVALYQWTPLNGMQWLKLDEKVVQAQQQGDFAELLKILDEALPADKPAESQPRVLALQAQTLVLQGNYQRATTTYDKLVALADDSADADLLISASYATHWSGESAEKVTALWRRAQALAPNYPRVQTMSGLQAYLRGDLRTAADLLYSALPKTVRSAPPRETLQLALVMGKANQRAYPFILRLHIQAPVEVEGPVQLSIYPPDSGEVLGDAQASLNAGEAMLTLSNNDALNPVFHFGQMKSLRIIAQDQSGLWRAEVAPQIEGSELDVQLSLKSIEPEHDNARSGGLREN